MSELRFGPLLLTSLVLVACGGSSSEGTDASHAGGDAAADHVTKSDGEPGPAHDGGVLPKNDASDAASDAEERDSSLPTTDAALEASPSVDASSDAKSEPPADAGHASDAAHTDDAAHGSDAGGGTLALGASCTASGTCASKACVDGPAGPICCAEACSDEGASSCGTNGTCEIGGASCARYGAGTVCLAASCVTATSEQGASTCDGQGTCTAGSTTTCTGGSACTGGTCPYERQASRISSGFENCVVIVDGTVECWTNGTPTPVAGVAGATDIAVGGDFACALLTGGAVECWGSNESGQLGNGNTSDSTAPVTVIGVHGATAISAGDAHACAVVEGGAVECWGANDNGQLGNGTTSLAATPIATDVTGLSGVSALGAGTSHTCAVSSGSVFCWGSNSFGEIGSSTVTSSSTPLEVPSLTGATAVAAGTYLSCAVAGGKVACWGSNTIGQLGDGIDPGASSSTPVFVNAFSGGDLTGAVSVTADTYFACAVLSGSGFVLCWGEAPACGAYGLGSESCGALPIATFTEEDGGQNLKNGVEVTPASCVLDSAGNVWCMQSDGYAAEVEL